MSWFEIAMPLLVGLIYLFVPGLLISAAARLRGFEAFGLAPALSVAAIMLGATVTPMLGIRWALWVPFASAVVLAAVILLVVLVGRWAGLGSAPARSHQGRWLPPQRSVVASAWWSKDQIAYWGSFLVGALLLWRNVTNAIGQPEWISQTWDNSFHLNAVRFIEETGSASPLTLGAMTTVEGEPTFYPGAWHAIVSLISMGSGADIPVATNTMALVVSAIIWPLSTVFMVRQIFKLNTAGVMVVGAFAAAFTAYPILLLDFGVLYPNLLGIALLPAGIGLVAQLFRMVAVRRISTLQSVVLGVWVALAIAIAHPNAIMSLLVMIIPLLLGRVILNFVTSFKHRAYWGAAGATALGVALIFIVMNILWGVVRPPQAAGEVWGPVLTQGQALGEPFAFAAMGFKPQWFLAIVFVIGLYTFTRRANVYSLWVLGAWAVVVYFYVAARSLAWEDGRYEVVGLWYHDSFRLAALLPVMSVPMLALAVHWVAEKLVASQWWQRTQWESTRRMLVVGAVALFTVVGFGQTSSALQNQVEANYYEYAPDSESDLLSTDEFDMLEVLDEYVPEGETVVVQPFTGAALAYAIADRPVTAYHTIYSADDDVKYVQDHLNQALMDPQVCRALDNLNADYYLDFGYAEVNGHDHSSWYAGFEGLAESGVLTEVHREGDAVLYKITACSAP